MTNKPSYIDFDKKNYAWQPGIDYKHYPEKYKVGKGEQGVLICEPYKSEIGQYWRFKTAQVAKESSESIYRLFLGYVERNDFVGADMARKFLQMGYTRSRRYANYKGGKKYDKENGFRQLERGTGEDEKAMAAEVFYKVWRLAEDNPTYKAKKLDWKKEKG